MPDAPDIPKLVKRYNDLIARIQDPASSDSERKVASQRLGRLVAEHPDLPTWVQAAADADAPRQTAQPGAGNLPPEAQAVLHALGRGLRQGADAATRDLTATWNEATEVARKRARERATHTARRFIDRFFDAIDGDDD